MKTRLLTAVSAAALSLALISAPAFAQEQQLSDSATAGMAALGMDTTGVVVTADQAAQIENVLGSTDTDSIKKAHIEEIIGGEATATGRLGTDQLRSSAAEGMASLGLDTEVVPMLTRRAARRDRERDRLAGDRRIRSARRSTRSSAATAAGAGAMGANDAAVMADVAGLGIDTNEIGVLSAAQMTQIQTVLSGAATDTEKKAQIERIIAE